MFNKNNDKYRSPINKKPLRRAGQSLEEELARGFDNEALAYLLTLGISFVILLFTWIHFFMPITILSASFMTIIALIVMLICFIKIYKFIKQYRPLKEGLKGELFMRDHLDTLRETGCKIFHDFVGEYKNSDGHIQTRNVDHIVVSSKGIFTIETKTMRKPNDRDEQLTYDGEELYFKSSGKKIPYPPFKQANGEAQDIKNFLMANIGEDFKVQPVVVYPGWFIDKSTYEGNEKDHKVWVCPPKYLKDRITKGQISLTPQQITVISTKLSDYIRSYERKD